MTKIEFILHIAKNCHRQRVTYRDFVILSAIASLTANGEKCTANDIIKELGEKHANNALRKLRENGLIDSERVMKSAEKSCHRIIYYKISPAGERLIAKII